MSKNLLSLPNLRCGGLRKREIEAGITTSDHVEVSFPPTSLQRAKTNQRFAFFIAQAQLQRPENCPQRDDLDGVKRRDFVVALLQIVVGNIRANVMNVMQANIAGEPLEYFGQLKVRAALQCHFHRIPRSVTRPVRVLKLMLNIEQPKAEAPGDQNDRQLDLEICPKTDCPRRQSDDEQECHVGAKHAPALRLSRVLASKSIET